jgi:hypothetical protein
MKKLMIAASVAACAAVGFALESANIVGYSSFSTTANTMDITGANFVGVGGEDLDLQNITVDENFSRFGGDSVRI